MSDFLPVQQHKKSEYWYALLELGFVFDQNRTILKHRKHFGPVRVQKMLWPEKTGVCHAIIVHPPAGIAGGDHLSFNLMVATQSHALVTTPGAGKWYKTNGKKAFQHINIQVESEAIFEWLPQETMLFDGANANSETCIQLAQSASLIAWDMLVLGRQARHEKFSHGYYKNQFKLLRNNQLLVADTLFFQGGDRFLSSCLGMNHHVVLGNFWAVPPEKLREHVVLDEHIMLLRELIVRTGISVTLSRLDDVICARYLGDDVRECHDAFAALRARLRKYWFDLEEEFPRIWRT